MKEEVITGMANNKPITGLPDYQTKYQIARLNTRLPV